MASTVITLVDDDGDEFPIALPGIFRTNRDADVEAAIAIAQDATRDGNFTPRGKLRFGSLEYREA